MKKVGIYLIYVKRCLVLKLFSIFIAGSVGYDTKNGS